MASVIIGCPSTTADWTAVCLDTSFGPQTFPRSVLCSFTVATSSKLTVAGVSKALITTTAVDGTVRYITN
jgi:hypothetical protein